MTDAIRIVHTEPGTDLHERFRPLHCRRLRVGDVRYVIYVNKPRRSADRSQTVSTIVVELSDSLSFPAVEKANHTLLREMAQRTDFPNRLQAERIATADRRLLEEQIRKQDEEQRRTARENDERIAAAEAARPDRTQDPAYQRGTRNMGSIRRLRQFQAAVTDPPADGLYWLNSKTGRRHRPSCDYYECDHGQYCEADIGLPCRVCGG